jgi:hypothetical protein
MVFSVLCLCPYSPCLWVRMCASTYVFGPHSSSWLISQPLSPFTVIVRMCVALSYKSFCLQADWLNRTFIAALLKRLFELVPCFIPASIKANVCPSLVNLMREASMEGAVDPDYRGLIPTGVDNALSCLNHLMRYDMTHGRGMWTAAVNAGVVPVLADLLTRPHKTTTATALELSGMLLMSAPRGEAGRWGSDLVRASARLLTANPPVAVRDAVEMLHKVGFARPELIADWQSWGIDDSLHRLTMHNDQGTAAAARQLETLLSRIKDEPDVSSNLAPHISSGGHSFVCFISAGR